MSEIVITAEQQKSEWDLEKEETSRRAVAKAQLSNTPERKAAGRVVMRMWIIFVCLPVVLGILFAILTAK